MVHIGYLLMALVAILVICLGIIIINRRPSKGVQKLTNFRYPYLK